MPLVDLSHDMEDGMITHPGLPGPVICDRAALRAPVQSFPVRAFAILD